MTKRKITAERDRLLVENERLKKRIEDLGGFCVEQPIPCESAACYQCLHAATVTLWRNDGWERTPIVWFLGCTKDLKCKDYDPISPERTK